MHVRNSRQREKNDVYTARKPPPHSLNIEMLWVCAFVFLFLGCHNKLLYEGGEPYMPPTALPPGDPNHSYRAKIKITAVDDFHSESAMYVEMIVRNILQLCFLEK